LRHLRDAVRTWKFLTHQDPEVVVAVAAPVFAPLGASLWSVVSEGF